MKKFTNVTKAMLLLATASLGLASCKKDFSNGDFNKSSKASLLRRAPIHLAGVYTSDMVLTNNNTYYLDGVVYFTGGADLYIEAGTHILTGSAVSYGGQSLKGVLVITKGSKILADGNRTNQSEASYNPDSTIVFGPDLAVTPNPVPGDFGGVILLGDAPTNVPTTTVIEGIPTSPPADVTFGGTDVSDTSGVMRYVRIEYPGFELTTDNEINGLTLGGVGSGTTLNHIQVSRSDDDSFEFFGGTVNADHLVALSGTDDDFDFDNGYSGTLSYCLALKDPGSPHTVSGGVSDANGIESDNNAGGTSTAIITKPTINHFTILGYATSTNASQLENGAHFRRLSGVNVQNSLIGGFPTGVRFENITTTGSAYQFNVTHGFTVAITPTTAPSVPAIFNLANLPTGTDDPANDFLVFDGGSLAFYNRANLPYDPQGAVPSAGASPADGGGIAGTYNGAFEPGVAVWTTNWTNFF